MTEENAKLAYDMIQQRLVDIGNLPWEQQSQAIGKIGGEVAVIFLGTGAVAKVGRNVITEWKGMVASWARNLADGNILLWARQVAAWGVEMVGWSGTIVMAEWVWMTGKAEKWITTLWKMFDTMSVEDIARLSNPERLEAWGVILKRELNEFEKQAIIDAHSVGMWREGAEIYNYTFWELKTKLQILEEAWFSKAERKLLLEKWVCGVITEWKLLQLQMYWDTQLQQLDALFELAQATRPQYDALLQSIWWQTQAINILDSQKVPLKSRDNVANKIETEYKWDIQQIWDILRWALLYDRVEDLQRWLQLFKESPDVENILLKDRINNPFTRDVLLNIQFKNWFVAEVQLHVKEILHAKESWYILPKDIIDVDIWSAGDQLMLQELKQGIRWERIVQASLEFPSQNKPVVWHHIYEISRALWYTIDGKKVYTPEELVFKQKLDRIQIALNDYAMDQYRIRTWQDFIQ